MSRARISAAISAETPATTGHDDRAGSVAPVIIDDLTMEARRHHPADAVAGQGFRRVLQRGPAVLAEPCGRSKGAGRSHDGNGEGRANRHGNGLRRPGGGAEHRRPVGGVEHRLRLGLACGGDGQ